MLFRSQVSKNDLMHFPCSRGQVPVADVVLYRIPENPCQIQKLSGFLLRLNETSGPVPDTNSGLMPSKSGFLSAIASVKTGLLDYHKSLFYVSS